jgi:hypothetical protein
VSPKCARRREFKIEVALPTRIGAVVSSGMGLSLLATAEPLKYGGVVLQAMDAHWVGDTIYALLR